MKRIFIGATALAALGATIAILNWVHTRTSDTIVIGIAQTASHPALDQVQRGFQNECRRLMGSGVQFIVKNAQGSVATAHTIAHLFANDTRLAGVLAIATPTAQAMAQVEVRRPVIFAAVTDPRAAGLIKPNICGVSDAVDVHATIQLARTLAPQAHTAAILFSVGEVGAVHMAEHMRTQLMHENIHVTMVGMAQEIDAIQAIERACTADMVICPIDNGVASTISLLAARARTHKKPLIVCDNELVRAGALAAAGVDYLAIGKQAAACAFQVLVRKVKPHNIPVATQHGTITINTQTLQMLGIALPESLAHSVLVKDRL